MKAATQSSDLLAALIAMQGKANERMEEHQTRITQLEQIILSEILPHLSSL